MLIEAEREVVSVWCARLTWALLPVSTGVALSDALDGWSTGPARLAAVMLWAAWTLGLIALLAPRPWGLTALRVVAPAAVVLTLSAIWSTSAASATLAVSTAAVAAAFALSAPVAQAAGNALAYGDEIRFPLRIPLALFFGPVPLAVALIAGGASVGPLLLANESYIAGAVVSVVGIALAFALARSLHSLSVRWLVLVPAGLVVVDPLALVDPVLMRREQIRGVERLVRTRSETGFLDLRLGTAAGTVAIALRETHPFARRRGRRDSALQEAAGVLVSIVRVGAFLRAAGDRRIAIS
jgi:hypothetical protein